MGASRYDGFLAFVSFMYLLFRWKLGISSLYKTKLRLKFKEQIFFYNVGSYYHMYELIETFIKREYDVQLPKEASMIVDLGSCSGAAAAYFSICYPRASILAFEPDSMNFVYAKENCGQFNNIEVINSAFSTSNGEIDFYESTKSSLASSLTAREGNVRHSVTSINLNSLIEMCGGKIDILKFDIEGAEEYIFSSENDLSRVGYLCGEIHEDLMDLTIDEIKVLLKRQGFGVNYYKKASQRYIIWAARQ